MKILDFLDSIDVPAYIVDNRRIIIYWNEAAERFLGYRSGDVIGSSCADNVLMHIDRNGIVVCRTDLCPLVRSMRSGKYFRVPFAVYSLKESGDRVPVSVYAFPLKDENGIVFGAIEMFEDATQSDRELSKAFEVQQSLLPKKDEKIDFVYYPSNVLGGDLIYYRKPWIMLIDVSDHGLASALLSTSIKIMLDAIFEENDPDISELPLLMEKEFSKVETDNYFTVIIGKLKEDHLEVISCAHPDPIVHSDGEAKVVEVSRTFPVGLGFIDGKIEPTVIDLGGREVLLYSDGVTETRVSKDEMLGPEGLAELFTKTQDLREIYETVMDRNAEVFQMDDISMVLVRG